MHGTGEYTVPELMEVFSVGRATVYRPWTALPAGHQAARLVGRFTASSVGSSGNLGGTARCRGAAWSRAGRGCRPTRAAHAAVGGQRPVDRV
jgi:hypothetical protein